MRVASCYLAFWLVLMVLAILNGFLREFVLAGFMPELSAHQLSTLLAAIIFAIAVRLLAKRVPLESARQAMVVGLMWLALTLGFEFGFGHYVAGHSWERLLVDYNLAKGRVWPLLLLWVSFLPYLANLDQKRKPSLN